MSRNSEARPVWIYTDVVCDLFHFGHVEFFRRARAMGDRLVVGLVGDADVATYKPAPVMTFEERAAVVASCRHVDRVLERPAPLHCTRAFLDEIGADLCCHGNDMNAEQLDYWYHDLIPANRLKVVPYTFEISSRQIVDRIVKRMQDGTLGERPALVQQQGAHED